MEPRPENEAKRSSTVASPVGVAEPVSVYEPPRASSAALSVAPATFAPPPLLPPPALVLRVLVRSEVPCMYRCSSEAATGQTESAPTDCCAKSQSGHVKPFVQTHRP